VVQIPQLYPFPKPEFTQILKFYNNANEVIWVQEEPRNMGAWPFIRGRITPVLEGRHLIGYAGRPESASTAPGSMKRHQREQKDVMQAAFAPPSVANLHRKKLVRRKKAR
jgi:2-oxoglutarate dehydrogenase E1 component